MALFRAPRFRARTRVCRASVSPLAGPSCSTSGATATAGGGPWLLPMPAAPAPRIRLSSGGPC
eukprot:7531983-Alexandrium_andersonii.AAC.1